MKLASSPSLSSSTVPLYEFHVAVTLGVPHYRSPDASSLFLARSSRSAALARITHALYTRVPTPAMRDAYTYETHVQL